MQSGFIMTILRKFLYVLYRNVIFWGMKCNIFYFYLIDFLTLRLEQFL